ncbi:Lrp/AsnC ligand binding domain-containing protein [Leucothrix pacifica]|uniref:Leucine-responsive regulatory protein n=1 Tax=Leucothrix pacifica TaxID=1247513 RepID=A0A317CRI6_9GAMM|nr:Lrp/AsnC ligand binding domain-containing protein [Leucothrix pacifica]PWR00702.1 AsnC family transcriptional regulator [Leucothrix pacifica]
MKTSKDTLSNIDKNILRILQDDGRITYAELARRVGLTTTPCIERVRRLERNGYIKHYSTVVDAEQLDAGLIVFVQLRLDRTSKDTFAMFKEAVLELPEVQECYLVSGSFDYLIKARLADMAQYRLFLEESLLSVPAVQESTSIVVMEAIKETLAIPIT